MTWKNEYYENLKKKCNTYINTYDYKQYISLNIFKIIQFQKPQTIKTIFHINQPNNKNTHVASKDWTIGIENTRKMAEYIDRISAKICIRCG